MQRVATTAWITAAVIAALAIPALTYNRNSAPEANGGLMVANGPTLNPEGAGGEIVSANQGPRPSTAYREDSRLLNPPNGYQPTAYPLWQDATGVQRSYLGDENAILAPEDEDLLITQNDPYGGSTSTLVPQRAYVDPLANLPQAAPPNGNAAPSGDPVDVDEDYAPVDDAQPAPAGQLTDRAVYELMLSSLNGSDRADFQQTWVNLSPEEQQSMLDQYRAQIGG